MPSLISLLALGSISGTSAWADFSYGVSVLPSLEEYKYRDWLKEYGRKGLTKSEYKLRF